MRSNRKSATYQRHSYFLGSFLKAVGKQIRPTSLKPHHVDTWIEGLELGPTTQNDAISIIGRMLDWSVERGLISKNPIAGIRKPKRKRRDVFYTDQQWQEIRKHATPPFDDLLDFMYLTGCRPIEARTLESSYVDGDMAIFPLDQSKGEQTQRVLYLVPEALKIVERMKVLHPTGPLFRNSRSNPWRKDSIKCRMTGISEAVGFRVIAYGIRHSWATNALTKGDIDPVSAAHLMSHSNPSMVANVYSHIAHNPEFLRRQAKKALRRKRTDD